MKTIIFKKNDNSFLVEMKTDLSGDIFQFEDEDGNGPGLDTRFSVMNVSVVANDTDEAIYGLNRIKVGHTYTLKNLITLVKLIPDVGLHILDFNADNDEDFVGKEGAISELIEADDAADPGEEFGVGSVLGKSWVEGSRILALSIEPQENEVLFDKARITVSDGVKTKAFELEGNNTKIEGRFPLGDLIAGDVEITGIKLLFTFKDMFKDGGAGEHIVADYPDMQLEVDEEVHTKSSKYSFGIAVPVDEGGDEN